METLQLTETTSEVSVFALQLDAGLDDGAASFYVADRVPRNLGGQPLSTIEGDFQK